MRARKLLTCPCCIEERTGHRAGIVAQRFLHIQTVLNKVIVELGRWLCKTRGKPGERWGREDGQERREPEICLPRTKQLVQEGRCAEDLSGCSTFVATRQARLRLCCGWRGCGGGQSQKEWESWWLSTTRRSKKTGFYAVFGGGTTIPPLALRLNCVLCIVVCVVRSSLCKHILIYFVSVPSGVFSSRLPPPSPLTAKQASNPGSEPTHTHQAPPYP